MDTVEFGDGGLIVQDSGVEPSQNSILLACLIKQLLIVLVLSVPFGFYIRCLKCDSNPMALQLKSELLTARRH